MSVALQIVQDLICYLLKAMAWEEQLMFFKLMHKMIDDIRNETGLNQGREDENSSIDTVSQGKQNNPE